MKTHHSALVVGSTGIVGSNLADRLVAQGWKVYGLARRPHKDNPSVLPIAADLTNATALSAALNGLSPTHVFLGTWSRQATEKENMRVNGAMVRNVLDAVAPAKSVQHVALVTGLKHYLGSFSEYGKANPPATPFREDAPRLAGDNFYYTQEDELFAAAARDGFGWSIHRPHTIIGHALGNVMNMGNTLAAYATLCRETGRPFIFPGSAQQWNGLTDITDARQLARHLEWAAISPAGRDQALNIVNGDIFRWKWMWPRIAEWFGVQPEPFPEEHIPLEQRLADAGPLWTEIASKHKLAIADFDAIASPWHTDFDLGMPMEVVTDMSKSRKLGFLDYQASDESFFDLFARLRNERIIP
ncbi:MAG TPA: SDR family oxidoreductase [Candidatus Methylacidiphilales bacterium]